MDPFGTHWCIQMVDPGRFQSWILVVDPGGSYKWILVFMKWIQLKNVGGSGWIPLVDPDGGS